MKQSIIIILVSLLAVSNNSFSQGTDGVLIDPNTTTTRDASAVFQAQSTSQGILVPRMTAAQRSAIPVSAARDGLMVYQTDAPAGFYYYNGATLAWVLIANTTSNLAGVTAGTGLTGGGTSGTITVNAVGDNGLTTNADDIDLGGPLTQAATTITQDGSETFTIANTGTGNTTVNLASTGDFDVQDNGTSALFVRDDAFVGVGTNAPGTRLHVVQNAATMNLEGTDHSYIQWYPDGFAAGRKAYTGYPSGVVNDFTIANEISGGKVALTTTSGNIIANSLAGTGNRFVVADASGNLTATSPTTAGVVTGAGTLNYIPKWTPNGSTLGNSLITDDATTITAGGQFDVTGGTGTGYTTAPIEIRTSAIAPRLAFHYSGVVASQIAVENSGTIAIRDNPGTGYENFIARDISANRNIYNQGILYHRTSAGQGSGAHGISWYDPSFVTWYDYMAPPGTTNAPSGTAAPQDATTGVTSWARRFNMENIATYGWLFESGANTAGVAPTVKFAINASNGNFHTIGNGYIDGTLKIAGGSPAAGRVLTSDAAGNATWAAPATSGTVTSVATGGNGITGGTITSTGTISLDYGTSSTGGYRPVGNFGQFTAHGTTTDFNTTPSHWGWNYVQGNTNAPNATSSQWYRGVFSLGDAYPARGAGGYSMELAYPRFSHSTAGVWMRTVENGTIGGWTRIDAGATTYANLAGIPTRTAWSGVHRGFVAEQLSWKNYGNSHTIFDASAGTSPDGGAVNNTNPAVNWSATYPTLMGWNGSSTYGVRVDVARYAESAGSAPGDNLGNHTATTTLNMNGSSITNAAEVYLTNWVRHNDNDGIYWSNNNWHIYPQDAADMILRTGSGNGGIKGTIGDATARGYIHWTTSNEIGFLNASRSWSLRVDNAGNTFATTSSRAPIFYDNDNTGYYTDPASTSNLNNLRFNYSDCINGTCPPSNAIRMTPNFHLNSGSGNAVILNWDNGTTGATQTLRVGNGASADVFYVYADGQCFTTNWFRPTGSSGVFFQSYGGGWHMTDGTWIRSYNSKYVYIDQYLRAEQGIWSGNGDVIYKQTQPGQYQQASGFNFALRGVLIENNESESGGFQANGDNANIWSPGDQDMVRFYDEDGMALKTVFNGNGTYSNPSDVNKKQNIKPVTSALDKLMAVNGYTYEFKKRPEEIEKGDMPEKTAGIIAQEVEKVMPELITNHGEDGKFVNYDGLTPYIIEGIKEQQQQIENIKETSSDFGSVVVKSTELWVEFNEDFTRNMAENSLPVITLTSNQPNVNMYIAEKNLKGFKIKVASQLPSDLIVDYIAMVHNNKVVRNVPEANEAYFKELGTIEGSYKWDDAKFKADWEAQKIKLAEQNKKLAEQNKIAPLPDDFERPENSGKHDNKANDANALIKESAKQVELNAPVYSPNNDNIPNK